MGVYAVRMNASSEDHRAMNHSGHGDHVGQFRRLFWIMLVLAVPTIAFSDMFASIIGYPLPRPDEHGAGNACRPAPR